MIHPTKNAFPATQETTDGLTVREYFAAMAMQGLLSAEKTTSTPMERIAAGAVKAADALIAALNGKPPTGPGPETTLGTAR